MFEKPVTPAYEAMLQNLSKSAAAVPLHLQPAAEALAWWQSSDSLLSKSDLHTFVEEGADEEDCGCEHEHAADAPEEAPAGMAETAVHDPIQSEEQKQANGDLSKALVTVAEELLKSAESGRKTKGAPKKVSDSAAVAPSDAAEAIRPPSKKQIAICENGDCGGRLMFDHVPARHPSTGAMLGHSVLASVCPDCGDSKIILRRQATQEDALSSDRDNAKAMEWERLHQMSSGVFKSLYNRVLSTDLHLFSFNTRQLFPEV